MHEEPDAGDDKDAEYLQGEIVEGGADGPPEGDDDGKDQDHTRYTVCEGDDDGDDQDHTRYTVCEGDEGEGPDTRYPHCDEGDDGEGADTRHPHCEEGGEGGG
jgi:hypothetical protein